MEKKWIVYCHTNKINGKKYVGITCQGTNKRWGNNGIHYKNSHHKKFANAILKYGWDNFDHEILEENISTLEEANKKEKYYIEFYDSFKNGYNSTLGGDGTVGKIPSKETREKMSKARIGKKLSEETKRKISEGHKNFKPWNTINAKQVFQYDLDNNLINSYSSAYQAQLKTGIRSSNIYLVCNGKRKTTGGYIWKYE